MLFFFWCHSVLNGGHNISKAEVHLAQITGFNVRPCDASIPPDFDHLYKQVFYAKQAAKATKGRNRERKNRAEHQMIDDHSQAVLQVSGSRRSNKKRCDMPSSLSQVAQSTPIMLVAPSATSIVMEAAQHLAQLLPQPQSIQLTFDGAGGEEMATAALCQAILKLGLPFCIIEDPLF